MHPRIAPPPKWKKGFLDLMTQINMHWCRRSKNLVRCIKIDMARTDKNLFAFDWVLEFWVRVPFDFNDKDKKCPGFKYKLSYLCN